MTTYLPSENIPVEARIRRALGFRIRYLSVFMVPPPEISSENPGNSSHEPNRVLEIQGRWEGREEARIGSAPGYGLEA